MSLIGDVVNRLLEPFWDKVRTVFAPFNKAFNFVGKFWTSLTTIGSRTRTLIDTIISEVSEWKNFKENIAFRTRLISLPHAIDHIQDIVDELRTAWASVQDLVKQIKSKFETTGNPTEEAEEAMQDIESSGFKGLFEKFPKLFKGLEKVLGFLALLLDALETISAIVDDLTAIVNVARDLRMDIETGEGFFLSQKNPRRTEELAEGGSIKIRVGNLH